MKYDIQEYTVAPEHEKADLVRRNDAFVHAVESAIKLGNEAPMVPTMAYGTERPTPFSAPMHVSIDNGPNRERLKSKPLSKDERRREASSRISDEIDRLRNPKRPKPEIGCFTVYDLSADVCAWPSGDIYSECAEHRFCGLPTMRRGVSYCAPHYRQSRPTAATATEPA